MREVGERNGYQEYSKVLSKRIGLKNVSKAWMK